MAETRQQNMTIGALATPRLDADGRLAEDIACRRCGYSLRGLTVKGQCPECSTPVGRSIHGDLLEFSDPRWVLRIARGGSVLVASIVLMILGTVTLALMKGSVSLGVLSAGMATSRIVQIAGVWLVTERDPGFAQREPPISARTLARYASIIAAALVVAVYLGGGLTLSVGRFHLPALAGAPPAAKAGMQLLMAGLSIASIVALLRYARGLALRLPDERLARQCARLAFWLAVLLSARAIIDALGVVSGKPPGNRMSAPVSTLDAFANLATALCMYLAIGLIFDFRSQLSRAATKARASWARPLR